MENANIVTLKFLDTSLIPVLFQNSSKSMIDPLDSELIEFGSRGSIDSNERAVEHFTPNGSPFSSAVVVLLQVRAALNRCIADREFSFPGYVENDIKTLRIIDSSPKEKVVIAISNVTAKTIG